VAKALTFVRFCSDVLGVQLEPGQLVFAKVAYDHVDPIDLPEDERSIARQIFGPVDRVPEEAHKVIASVIGGRSGKSYLATLRLLHLCCTVVLDGVLAPGQRAHAAIICPDVATAMEALVYFVGACWACPKLRDSIDPKITKTVIKDGKMVEGFVFKRPLDGRFVEVAVRAVRQGGANVRGRWYVGALMDEACLFFDASYKLSDDVVYKAIKPRIVMPGGQLLLSSTPWLDAGVLYTLWETEFGKPQTALVAHAPTLVLRPTNAGIRATVEGEYKTDPENARREFGAEFGTGNSADWIDRISLRRCVREAAQPKAVPGEEIGAGGDLGFARNSSALVVVVRDPKTGRIRVTRIEERRPQMGKPLKPSEVCGEFAQLLRADGCEVMTADRHYAETAREALDASGLLLGSPPDPDEAWTLVRDLVRSGLLDLSEATPEGKLLIKQLLAAKARRVAKGRVAIVLEATKDGRHGDLAAAFVLACWAAVHRPTRVVKPANDVVEPADEWEAEDLADEARQGKGAHWWK
jgi:hypothetical protein